MAEGGKPIASSSGSGARVVGLAFTVCCLLVAPALAGAAPGAGTGVDPPHPYGAGLERVAPEKPEHTEILPGESHRKVILKFDEGTEVRLRGGDFTSLADDRLGALHAVLEDYPGVTEERLIESSSEASIERQRERTEATSGRDLADFNLYYRLSLPSDTDAEALIDDLNALGVVELAQAAAGLSPPPNHAGPTPSFVARQTWRGAAPAGINAVFANAIPGGLGQNVRVLDLENDWLESHEDLDSAVGGRIANGPQPAYDDLFTDHGTAVLSELIATDDAVGVTGLIHGAEIRFVETFNTTDGSDRPDAINIAVTNSQPGDVILLEQQTPGANGGCNLMTQDGCVAVEWDQPEYDAIVAATAAGRIVVEAAGNGNENIGDTADYGNPFPAGRADSGAIIVGAGGNNYDSGNCAGNTNHARLSFSTFGPRVNYHAFGECIVTAGYGTLLDDPDDNFDYRGTFGGTSGASPMIAAAAGILSSVAIQRGDADGLTSVEARTLLANGATPQDTSSDTGNIGPMPNLQSALGAPTADAGGPYNAAEGTTVNLSATGSADQAPGTISTYEWDLDNDSQYDDATGSTTSFTRGDNAVFPIGLKVTDNDGLASTDSSTVTLANVDPTATLDPAQDTTIAKGDTLSAAATFTDPGYDDTYSGLIDWGDGGPADTPTPNVTTQGPPADEGDISSTHVYPDPGTYPVAVTVFDDNGGNDVVTFDLTVVPRCQGIPATVVGTPASEELTGTSGPDVVYADDGDDRIHTGDDDDVICAGPGDDRAAGRAGNDIVFEGPGEGSLSGGAGADALFGSGEDDLLRGGAGVDFLKGGSGKDRFHGGSGTDDCDNNDSETAQQCES